MKKILITGGAGYLGAEITTHFIELGYDVTVLDSLLYNKNTLDHLKKKNNFKFINGDVRNKSLYLKEISNNDIIFPLAGIVGAPLCEKFENEAYEVNEQGLYAGLPLRSTLDEFTNVFGIGGSVLSQIELPPPANRIIDSTKILRNIFGGR